MNTSEVPLSAATMLNCNETQCDTFSWNYQELQRGRLLFLNDVKAVQYIPITIYVTMLMVVGVLGNALVVYIYRRRFKKTSSNYFILTMAVFDLVACLISMPTEIYDLRYPYAFYSATACKISRFIEAFTIYGSACVLVEIAFDRYFKICRPLMLISLFKIKMLCIFSLVLALILSVPAAVLYGLTNSNVPGTNVMGFDCSIDQQYSKTTFQVVYFAVLASVFLTTLAILTGLYIRIWVEIRSRQRMVIGDMLAKPSGEHGGKKKKTGEKRKKTTKINYNQPSGSDAEDENYSNINNGHSISSGKSVRSRFASLSSFALMKFQVSRTTVVLFAVTVAFLISYMPSIAIMLIRSTVKDIEQTQSPTAEVISKFFSKFFLINNAINPIIYSFLNNNFRRQAKIAMKNVMCCCHRRKRCPQKSDSDRSTKKEMIPIEA